MNAREVIDEVIRRTVQQGWQCDVQTDDILDALAAAGFVVVACPPGSRVVVDRTEKPCERCGGTTADPTVDFGGQEQDCLDCGGSGVVEATTIHAVEPGRGEMVWESQGGAEVPRWVETWRAVALPDDDFDFDDGDLGGCPYYARYCGLEGHDPEAVCFQMGVCQSAGEPQCVTCEPTEGWRRAAADLPVQPLPEETPQ